MTTVLEFQIDAQIFTTSTYGVMKRLCIEKALADSSEQWELEREGRTAIADIRPILEKDYVRYTLQLEEGDVVLRINIELRSTDHEIGLEYFADPWTEDTRVPDPPNMRGEDKFDPLDFRENREYETRYSCGCLSSSTWTRRFNNLFNGRLYDFVTDVCRKLGDIHMLAGVAAAIKCSVLAVTPKVRFVKAELSSFNISPEVKTGDGLLAIMCEELQINKEATVSADLNPSQYFKLLADRNEQLEKLWPRLFDGTFWDKEKLSMERRLEV